MSYTINPNAKNKWVRNAENTMDLSIETDAGSVYLDNGRTLEQELGEGSMVSNVATVDSAMSKVIDGTLDGVYESGVMYGRSLVNLSNLHKSFNDVTLSGYYVDTSLCETSKLKLGTPYTLVFYTTAHGGDHDIYSGFELGVSDMLHATNAHPKTTTNYWGTLVKNGWSKMCVTFTDFLGYKYLSLRPVRCHVPESGKSIRFSIEGFILLEGDWSNKDLPFNDYFEGICDVKMPILRNVGKNLFDINGKIDPYHQNNYSVRDGVLNVKGAWYVKQTLPLKPNTKYVARLNVKGISGSGWKWAIYCNRTDEYVTSGGTGKWTFTTPSTFSDISILFYSGMGQKGEAEFSNIQIEESPIATSYEDYKTNILHTPETVTLRSLPNGVRDELNLKTGEYTKRIKEIVLDGSEKWMNFRDETDTTWRTSFSLPDAEPSSVCICDKFVYSKGATEERVKIYVTSTPKLSITVLKSEFPDLDSFKEWLLVNKPVVQYQLATPITTKVVLTQSEPIVKIGTELPNGVCDTYNLLTGEHIQRAGKVVLDGSEDWQSSGIIMQGYTGFWLRNLFYSNNEICLCDNFESSNFSSWSDGAAKEFITYNTIQNDVCIRILSSRLSLNTLDGFKQWLKENPTTVWYELKTPIVTKKNGLPNTHGVTLPNGEADKYNESTGVYTQNLGKVVLDGSQDEEWTIVSSLSLTNTIAFQYMLSQGSSSRADNLICNSFTPQEGSSDIEHIRSAWAEDGAYKAIALFINKTKLPTPDVSGLRSYLASNNIELYYSLPVSKTIDIPLINVGQVLPNGVCDTYNPITKEYVKRVSGTVLVGNEDWSLMNSPYETDCIGFVTPCSLANWTQSQANLNVVCEGYVGNYELWNVDEEGFSVFKTPTRLAIKVKRSKLSTVDINGFKKFLKLNPLAVWYELATPEISTVDLDLSTLYSSSPIAYENGHVTLESGHNGQSLLPTLEYSTITNRVKQIESISEQVLRQEKQLTMLEQMLIQNIINLDYNNTLLTLKNEMEEML